MKFCKIVELPDEEQVLVMKDYEQGEATPYKIKLVCDIDGVEVVALHSFASMKLRDRMFDLYNVIHANSFREAMKGATAADIKRGNIKN